MTQLSASIALADVQAALKNNKDAAVASITLQRPASVNMDSVARFVAATPGSNLVELAAQLNDCLAAYNQELASRSIEARKKGKELGNAFAQEMFGCPVPGDVTLPHGHSGRSITFRVESLESVHETERGLHGYVRVSSHGGMCHSSERFYTHEGRLHFAEPDLY